MSDEYTPKSRKRHAVRRSKKEMAKAMKLMEMLPLQKQEPDGDDTEPIPNVPTVLPLPRAAGPDRLADLEHEIRQLRAELLMDRSPDFRIVLICPACKRAVLVEDEHVAADGLFECVRLCDKCCSCFRVMDYWRHSCIKA